MKIVFSAIGSGFANNGGTKTILSCANVLHDLGHEVYIATKVFDFTWFKVRAKRIDHLPVDCDLIIATANATVVPLLKHVTRAKKLWYVRGWETWSIPEDKMIGLCKKIDCIVNSEWLQKKIQDCCNKTCPIVYPGMDTDLFFQQERENKKLTIGGLYSSRPLKHFRLWSKMFKKLNGTRAILLSDEKKPDLPFDFEFYRRPNADAHRKLYNECDIWVFTSENEGLHIPPMEAGLCNCALVGKDIGGVRDYAIHGHTALIEGDLYENVSKLINNRDMMQELASNVRELLLTKIGSRRHNMEKFVKLIKEQYV